MIWSGFSSTKLPENEISILTSAGSPNVGQVKQTTPVRFLLFHKHSSGAVIDIRVWTWSVKATDGLDRIESAVALSFLIPRAHVILLVYPLSVFLEGVAKTNDLEMVRMCPNSTFGVFEVESGHKHR